VSGPSEIGSYRVTVPGESGVALIVIAKAPVAGRVKTRLCPPCTPAQAAAVAEAALTDTLAAVAATPARRRLLALDGAPGPWLPGGFEVVPQSSGGLGDRLADAFARAGGPAFLVGMDTPQVTPALLHHATGGLADVDAVLGLAADGGYWGIGLRRPDAAAFAGVPMSTAHTGRAQRERLRALGLRVRDLPGVRDVDTYADACAVARLTGAGSAFSAAVAELDLREAA
jgi:rSAM/selenodomain-associated transferase 1